MQDPLPRIIMMLGVTGSITDFSERHLLGPALRGIFLGACPDIVARVHEFLASSDS